jgi:hypothetical protein
MATYPSFIKQGAIFNATDPYAITTIDLSNVELNYLHYPTAQGIETFQNINNLDNNFIYGGLDASNIYVNEITFPDNTIQTTAEVSLSPYASIYTANTGMYGQGITIYFIPVGTTTYWTPAFVQIVVTLVDTVSTTASTDSKGLVPFNNTFYSDVITLFPNVVSATPLNQSWNPNSLDNSISAYGTNTAYNSCPCSFPSTGQTIQSTGRASYASSPISMGNGGMGAIGQYLFYTIYNLNLFLFTFGVSQANTYNINSDIYMRLEILNGDSWTYQVTNPAPSGATNIPTF